MCVRVCEIHVYVCVRVCEIANRYIGYNTVPGPKQNTKTKENQQLKYPQTA